MKWKFKKDAEVQNGDDFWYDLFDGGYIRPEEVLESEKQLKKLNEAIDIVESFRGALIKNDLLNEF